MKKKKGQKKKTKQIENKNIVKVESKKEEIVEERKLLDNKIFDVLLVIIAIAFLLFIHHFALENNYTDDSYVYYTNEEGLPHLFDMDSYYYSRKTREFTTGETKGLISMRSNDKYQTAISDTEDSKYTLFLSKIVSIIYKFVSMFKDVSLYKVIIYSSPLLSVLVAIPSYIFIKRRTNRVGAFFAAVLSGVTIAYFSHWTYGCFDTDVLLYTIPLIYMAGFFESLIEPDKKKRIMWICLSSLFFVFLIFTWDVFGVYYFLTVGLTLVLLIINLFKEDFKFKNIIKLPEMISSFICVISYTILSFIFNKGIDISILRTIWNTVHKGEFNTNSYPNPGQYTSELRSINLVDTSNMLDASSNALVNRLGGIFIVVLFIIGSIYIIKNIYKYLHNSKKVTKEQYLLGVILIVWVIGGLVSVSAGSRFVKIAAIPFNLIASYSIGMLYEKNKNSNSKIPIILLSFAFLIAPCLGAYKVAINMSHSADDALVETGNFLKKNTKKDDVIVTWWDYGYFFEYQSQRRLVADGGTFNGRFSYFLANALVSENEVLTANTLKMLANSGVNASHKIDEYLGSAKKGSKALLEVLAQRTKAEASLTLTVNYGLTYEQAEEIVNLTHPDLDYNVYLVLTSSMLRMKSAYNYFAHYNFDNGGVTQEEISENSVYLKLYEIDRNTECFSHLYRNTDILNRLSTNVFLIK